MHFTRHVDLFHFTVIIIRSKTIVSQIIWFLPLYVRNTYSCDLEESILKATGDITQLRHFDQLNMNKNHIAPEIAKLGPRKISLSFTYNCLVEVTEWRWASSSTHSPTISSSSTYSPTLFSSSFHSPTLSFRPFSLLHSFSFPYLNKLTVNIVLSLPVIKGDYKWNY